VSHAKPSEPIEMPFGRLTWVGRRNRLLAGIKVGWIHSQPGGEICRRCSLSSKFFDHFNQYYAKAV